VLGQEPVGVRMWRMPDESATRANVEPVGRSPNVDFVQLADIATRVQ